MENPFAKDGQEAGENGLPNDDGVSQINEEDLLDQEELTNQWKKMKANMNSSRNLRQFLQGCQFCAKFKGVRINIIAPSRLIVKGN